VLAAHGADVLHVGAAHLPVLVPLWYDTAPGKRSCRLDLRAPADRATFEALVRDADVLVQSYRPGALAGLGYDPAALDALRPGIVVVAVSAWGSTGPWGRRRGFDSLVQSAAGIAHEQMVAAGADHPVPLPCQALDHATGWLAAAGAVAALRRRAVVGGGTLVELSLARTAAWLDALGRVDDGLAAPAPSADDVAPFLEDADSPSGRLTRVRPPGATAGPPPRWDAPPPEVGADPPTWR
jgi:crotonobetainyl-CoA:carnitine CoA-transferase CaiB-like acyl-CoA transferase